MNLDKYISLETNIIKLVNKVKSLNTLEDPNFVFFCGHGYGERPKAMRKYKKVIRKTKKRLKRLLVVIEKQKLQQF